MMGRLIWSGNDGESKTMCKKYPINTIAICGQTATGKNFIVNKLLEYYPHKLNRIVSYTTRPPRANEVDGVDYHFITEEEFKKSIEDNEFLEWKVFNNWYYGTKKNSFYEVKPNIAIFNAYGIEDIVEHYHEKPGKLLIVYLTCPLFTQIKRYLKRASPDSVLRRIKADKRDFNGFEKFVKSSNRRHSNMRYIKLDTKKYPYYFIVREIVRVWKSF